MCNITGIPLYCNTVISNTHSAIGYQYVQIQLQKNEHIIIYLEAFGWTGFLCKPCKQHMLRIDDIIGILIYLYDPSRIIKILKSLFRDQPLLLHIESILFFN